MGPGHDDITREAVATATGSELQPDERAMEFLAAALVWLGPALSAMPQAALAAVIVSAGLAIIDLDGLRVDAVKHVEEVATRNISAAIRETFDHSHRDRTPWTVIRSDDKYRARLAAIETVRWRPLG